MMPGLLAALSARAGWSSPCSCCSARWPSRPGPSSSPSARTRSSTGSSTGACCRGRTSTCTTTPAEADLAPAALAYAEASYDTLSVQFGHEVAEPHPADRVRLAHRLRADQHPAVHAARGPARRDRLPQAPGGAAVPRQLRRVPPHDAPRDGARVPARHADRELQPGAPRAALQLPALVDRGAGGALVGGAGRARRDGDARPHAERPAAAVQAAHLRHQRHRLSASAGRSTAGSPTPTATGGRP